MAVLANIDFSGGIGDFIDLFDGVPSSAYQLPLPYSIPAINPTVADYSLVVESGINGSRDRGVLFQGGFEVLQWDTFHAHRPGFRRQCACRREISVRLKSEYAYSLFRIAGPLYMLGE